MARIKVDLHDIYNNSAAIDKALQQAFNDAIENKIREVEIIPGKGSGQLRKKVERFLQQPHIKPLYHRIENDSKNLEGCLFILNFNNNEGFLLNFINVFHNKFCIAKIYINDSLF